MIPHDNFTKPLFPFRRELKLFRGPDEPDGSPTYNLFDPVRSKYFKINWEQSLIFNFFKGGMSASQLAKLIQDKTTTSLKEEDIFSFFEGMARAGLLQIPKSSEQLMEHVEASRVNPIKWLLLHYLYVRIPLFNPDRFLTDTLSYVRPLASKMAFFIYFSLTFLGVMAVLIHFEEYIGTFLYFFSAEGITAYVLCIVLVKLIHEFSHAYTAKYYGIHVPTMGVVFLVLWPAMYTDVTHGWSLRNRKHRLAITIAGVLSELVVAGITSLLWAITAPGILNSTFFILSSSTWLVSLFINLNPAMRFDGYYLLSDLWGIDNLQNRAFSMTRWQLRKTFLGLDVPPPEMVTKKRLIGMVVYTIYTWTYRIFLYTAIALFVYHKFTKTLGVFLFFIEVLVFMVWPLYWEYQELYQLRHHIRRNPKMTLTFTGLFLLFLWLLLPLPHTLSYSAVTAPIEEQIIYAPEEGIIKQILVKRGDIVKEGDLLIQIDSPKLNHAIATAENERMTVQKEIHILGMKDKTRLYLGQKEAENATYDSLLKQLRAEKEHLSIKAKESGKLHDWNEDLKLEQPISKDEIFGKIADPTQVKVIFFVPDTDLKYIQEGESIEFIIPQPRTEYQGVITRISPINDALLHYPALASHHVLPVVKDPKEDIHRIVESYYAVEVEIKNSPTRPLRFGLVGEVKVSGTWYSILHELMQKVSRVLWRESGT